MYEVKCFPAAGVPYSYTDQPGAVPDIEFEFGNRRAAERFARILKDGYGASANVMIEDPEADYETEIVV